MHKLYMHHGAALRGGRANRSAKLGWQKERARPARSYCQPMMHFIFILQVDLVGNWLYYSISEEMSSNLTRFLNPIANQIDLQYKNEMYHGLAVRPCRPGPFLLPSQLGRTVSTPASQGNTMMHVQLVHGFESWSAQKKICQTDLKVWSN